jgi:hypothetical protein
LRHRSGCADAVEKRFGGLHGVNGRGCEPVEIVEVLDLHCSKTEQKLGDIGTCDLWSSVVRTEHVVFFGIEAKHLARAGAACSSGSLSCGCFADAADLECGQAGPRRVGRRPRQAAVDNGGNSLNGDGTFRNVGGEDELSFRGRQNGAVLLGGREVAV